MRTGVRIGVDVGSVRVGVARSDPQATLAVPVTVLRRDHRSDSDRDALAAIVEEHEALEVLVGLPTPLAGGANAATRSARDYAQTLAEQLGPVPVRLVDERFSTVEAARTLREAGKRGPAARAVIDAAAAVVLLQAALDTERLTGEAPGELVHPAGAQE